MQYIEIEPTYKSPRVIFDPSQGLFSISGKSILMNVEEFYEPLIAWMDEYIKDPACDSVCFTFDIEYFNLASTKRFLFLLMKLNELQNKGISVEVNWNFASNDKYILEMGKDLSQMVKIPFNFVGYERLKEIQLNVSK